MKTTLRPAVACAFALLMSVTLFAQTPEVSTLPLTEPTDVGGTILQPGTYLIRVLRSQTDRNKVQITDPERKKVYASLLTVPHALEPNEEVPNTTFVFYPAGEGMPRALRTWFAPDPRASQGGHDIVYEASRARQLARLSHSPVVSYSAATEVADFDNAPLQVLEPEAEMPAAVTPAAPSVAETTESLVTTPEPVVTAPPAEPESMTSSTTESAEVAENQPVELPQTASQMPLIALLGIASLAGAAALRLNRS